MNEIFLEELPKWGDNKEKCKARNGSINWEESIGCKVKGIYDDINFEVEIVDYIKNEQRLHIKYKNRCDKISTGLFSNCRLGKILGKRTSDFKVKIGTRFKDDKRDITIIDRKYMGYTHKPDSKERVYKQNKKYYKYKCNKCGFDCGEHYKNGEHKEEHWIEEGKLLNGGGCSCCCPSPQVVVPEINSIVANEETHWMIPYFQGGYDEAKKYTPRCHQNIYFMCPDCGRKKSRRSKIGSLYKYHSIGCSCGDGISYPEKFMFNILEQLNIKFQTQYLPRWSDNKKYDFHIPSLNMIIETHGLQHYEKSGRATRTLKEEQENDKYKKELALKNKINKYVVIDCKHSNLKYIKNSMLNSELDGVFDLSLIDWNDANEFAWYSNLKKEVCEYWNNKEEGEMTIDLANRFNIHRKTVVEYLKQGSKIWDWCEYNPKEERKKSALKVGKMAGKYVEIFKDDTSLGVFPSCAELERQSEELFGIELKTASISLICLGKQKKTYKGFTFKYIEDNKTCA